MYPLLLSKFSLVYPVSSVILWSSIINNVLTLWSAAAAIAFLSADFGVKMLCHVSEFCICNFKLVDFGLNAPPCKQVLEWEGLIKTVTSVLLSFFFNKFLTSSHVLFNYVGKIWSSCIICLLALYFHK